MNHGALGPGPEFDRIRAIARELGDGAAALDDDCAVLAPVAHAFVLSTDVSVEGVHFRREWLTLEEIGWRAAAAALSDLAAEGASPVGVLVALTSPAEASEAEMSEVMRGVGAAVTSVGGRVLGGDLSSGPAWSIAVTVVGTAERPVTRSGAIPGDSLWVTGTLGAAGAAVDALLANAAPRAELRHAFARPEPRIREGRWLAAHGAHAMIDLSDGIGADAAHIAAASGVRVEIAAAQLPSAYGVDPARAAAGGEDYELLVAMPAAFAAGAAAEFTAACRTRITCVGRIAAGSGVRLELDGAELRVAGYDHFRSVDASPGGR